MTDPTPTGPQILTPEQWTTRRDRHHAAVDDLLAGHLQRRAAHRSHPVHDFLFTYYSLRPNQLRRWHPGHGTVLLGARAVRDYRDHPGYRTVTVDGSVGVQVADELLDRRGETVEFVARLLAATASRPPQLGCFGLHEWAMVYRPGRDEVRHAVPLRLGSAGTDTVVESMQLRCSHYDAYRFFTPAAAPRNAAPLTRDDQLAHEQPGCLHAGMDLYKWCYKLLPLVDSDLTLRCFRHAAAARELDMRASPYDLGDYGYSPIKIETAAGRAQYVREQSALTSRAAALRQELVNRCTALRAHRSDAPFTTGG